MGSQWQPVGNVMIFVPTTPAPTRLEQSLARLSVFDEDNEESGLTAVMGRTGNTYEQPIDLTSDESEGSSSSQEPSTSSVQSGASSGSMIHLPPWYVQLGAFAALQAQPAALESTPASQDALSDDGTDFLENDPYMQTPCPLPSPRAAPGYTSSRTPQNVPDSLIARPVMRTLFPRSSATRRTHRKTRRGLEYRAKNHPWSDVERRALCVLLMFFKENPSDFSDIISDHFSINVDKGQVTAQCSEYRKKPVARGYMFYEVVSSISRRDHRYATIKQAKQLLKATASRLNIQLQDSSELVRSKRVSADKVTFVHKVYRSLVENTSPETGKYVLRSPKVTPAANVPEEVHTTPHDYNKENIDQDSSLEITLRQQIEQSEDHEFVIGGPKSPGPIRSKLAFRVWDSESWSPYVKDRGFLSGVHGLLKDPRNLFGRPFDTDSYEGKRTLLLNSALHLHPKGGLTKFVSVTTSLLQALVYCQDKKDPMIAVVDMQHPSLHTENKMYYAGDIIPWLRKNKEFEWSHTYRGSTEYIVWKDIPEHALHNKLPVSDLFSLANRRPSCARVLNVDLLTSRNSVRTIADQLDKTEVYIDEQVARGMGRIAREFGFSRHHISLLGEFVSELMGSFYLKMGDVDMNSRSTIASAFAVSFTHEAHPDQDVMAAFLEGIDERIESTQSWRQKRKR